MSLSVIYNNTMWKLDPTNKHTTLSADSIIEWCGIAPSFFADTDEPKTVEEIIEKAFDAYGFPASESSGGKIDECGVYYYPCDPELYPLMRTIVSGVIVNIYQYGLVSIGDRVFRFD